MTEHAEAEPLEPEQPEVGATPRPVRRRVVGPFSLRQVTIAILAVMGTATVLTLATVPIQSISLFSRASTCVPWSGITRWTMLSR